MLRSLGALGDVLLLKSTGRLYATCQACLGEMSHLCVLAIVHAGAGPHNLLSIHSSHVSIFSKSAQVLTVAFTLCVAWHSGACEMSAIPGHACLSYLQASTSSLSFATCILNSKKEKKLIPGSQVGSSGGIAFGWS